MAEPFFEARSHESLLPVMKSTPFIYLAISGLASAYPNILQHLEEVESTSGHAKRQTPITTPPFDAKSQYVDTTGSHAFKAPGPNDQRGPCPGLNAMANHGYLPHNGIATIDQFIEGTGKGRISSPPPSPHRY